MLKRSNFSFSPPEPSEETESQAHPVLIDAAAVAAMTAEEVEEGLRELGLDASQPLPRRVRLIIAAGESESLRRVLYCWYVARKFYGRLLNLIPDHPFLRADRGAARPPRRFVAWKPALICTLILVYVSPLADLNRRQHMADAEFKQEAGASLQFVTSLGTSGAQLLLTPCRPAASDISCGVIADDYKVLPYGARLRLSSGSYSSEYVIADAHVDWRSPSPHTEGVPPRVVALAVFDASKAEEEIEALERRAEIRKVRLKAFNMWRNLLSEKVALSDEKAEALMALSKKLDTLSKRDEAAAEALKVEVGSLRAAPVAFTAAAYSLRYYKAGVRPPRRFIITTNKTKLPRGTRVRLLQAGSYNGEYVVAGRNREIDILVPRTRFGWRPVATILSGSPTPASSAREKGRVPETRAPSRPARGHRYWLSTRASMTLWTEAGTAEKKS
jgi:hypothetical protein